MKNNTLQISVVIPTINRKEVLIDTLSYLNKQKNICFEVIIIDQSDSNLLTSNDVNTFEFETKYFVSKNKNASHARNLGILESSSEIVLILDDDVIINDESFLLKHYLNYNISTIDGVFGQVLQKGKEPTGKRNLLSYNNKFGWMFFPPNYNARVKLFGIGMAGNLSFRKSKAIEVGAMDENYIKGAYREESDFLMRMYLNSCDIVFDPSCSLIHIGNDSGGIRSWTRSLLRPYHHCVSEWYFNLKYMKYCGFIPSLYSLFRRQVFFGGILRNPKYIYPALKQVCLSFFEAKTSYKSGSKYIEQTSYDNVERLF